MTNETRLSEYMEGLLNMKEAGEENARQITLQQPILQTHCWPLLNFCSLVLKVLFLSETLSYYKLEFASAKLEVTYEFRISLQIKLYQTLSFFFLPYSFYSLYGWADFSAHSQTLSFNVSV